MSIIRHFICCKYLFVQLFRLGMCPQMDKFPMVLILFGTVFIPIRRRQCDFICWILNFSDRSNRTSVILWVLYFKTHQHVPIRTAAIHENASCAQNSTGEGSFKYYFYKFFLGEKLIIRWKILVRFKGKEIIFNFQLFYEVSGLTARQIIFVLLVFLERKKS